MIRSIFNPSIGSQGKRFQLLFRLLSLCLFLLCCSTVHAQGWQNNQPTGPRAMNPLQKLNQFHQNVKRKLSGIGKTLTPQQPSWQQGGMNPPYQDSQQRLITNAPNHREQVQQAQYQEPVYPNRQYRRVASSSELNQRVAPFAYDQRQVPSGFADERHEASGFRDPGNGNVQMEAEYQNQQSGGRPFPVTDYRDGFAIPPNDSRTGSANPSVDQYAGLRQVGGNLSDTRSHYGVQAGRNTGQFQQGTVLRGQELPRPQLTATERALQLESENRMLKSERDALIVENQRLRNLLDENRELLSRIEKAIAAARQELQHANGDNDKLKRQIFELENMQRSQQMESERLLDSIRQRLDDVLMREISNN